MITSSSIPYISQMLNEPQSITDADIDSIVSLTETYPYFVPARYMEAASLHKHKPFDPGMMNTMQLYMGNWIVFHEYMHSANSDEPIPEAIATYIPADMDLDEEVEDVAHDIESIWTQDEEEDDDTDVIVSDEEAPATLEEYIEDGEVEEDIIGEEDEDAGIEEAAGFEEEFEDEEEEYDREYADIAEEPMAETHHVQARPENDEALILPIYTEDYFLHQGIQVSNNIPAQDKITAETNGDDPKSLMIVMSYADWLMHFKTHGEKVREEETDQKALKTMWQKEKLAAAMEEENEEIPENVFEMAVNSITKEDGLASESLAEIYIKQGKYDAAIDMYKKLSLRNPQKSTYFARKVEEILKEK
jgi:tetratricopeptide (TPR) repeat protein